MMNWNSKKFGLSMSNGWNDNFKTFLKKAQEENPIRENNRNSIYAENHPQQGTRVVVIENQITASNAASVTKILLASNSTSAMSPKSSTTSRTSPTTTTTTATNKHVS